MSDKNDGTRGKETKKKELNATKIKVNTNGERRGRG